MKRLDIIRERFNDEKFSIMWEGMCHHFGNLTLATIAYRRNPGGEIRNFVAVFAGKELIFPTNFVQLLNYELDKETVKNIGLYYGNCKSKIKDTFTKIRYSMKGVPAVEMPVQFCDFPVPHLKKDEVKFLDVPVMPLSTLNGTVLFDNKSGTCVSEEFSNISSTIWPELFNGRIRPIAEYLRKGLALSPELFSFLSFVDSNIEKEEDYDPNVRVYGYGLMNTSGKIVSPLLTFNCVTMKLDTVPTTESITAELIDSFLKTEADLCAEERLKQYLKDTDPTVLDNKFGAAALRPLKQRYSE